MLTDLLTVAEIISAITLCLILFQQSYATWQERKDKRLEKEERPHFRYVGLRLDEELLELVKEGTRTARIVKLGVVKIVVGNKGAYAAKNAQPFVHLSIDSETKQPPSIWTAQMGTDNVALTITVPSPTGDSYENLADAVKLYYLKDKEWGQQEKRDIAPGLDSAAVCFFTIEGCDRIFHPNPNVGSRPIPRGKIVAALSVVMDNAPESTTFAKPFRMMAWNRFEFL